MRQYTNRNATPVSVKDGREGSWPTLRVVVLPSSGVGETMTPASPTIEPVAAEISSSSKDALL